MKQRQRKAAFGVPFLTASELDEMEYRARRKQKIDEGVDEEFEAFKQSTDAAYDAEPLESKYMLDRFLDDLR